MGEKKSWKRHLVSEDEITLQMHVINAIKLFFILWFGLTLISTFQCEEL